MILAIPMTIIGICVVLIIRNFLTGLYLRKRLDEIHTENLHRLEKWKQTKGPKPVLLDYNLVDKYDSYLFNPFIWTYRQFFPVPASSL